MFASNDMHDWNAKCYFIWNDEHIFRLGKQKIKPHEYESDGIDEQHSHSVDYIRMSYQLTPYAYSVAVTIYDFMIITLTLAVLFYFHPAYGSTTRLYPHKNNSMYAKSMTKCLL